MNYFLAAIRYLYCIIVPFNIRPRSKMSKNGVREFFDKTISVTKSQENEFRHINFSGLDFTGLDLENIKFLDCDFGRCIFQGENHQEEEFTDSPKYRSLIGPKMANSSFNFCNFEGATFSRASDKYQTREKIDLSGTSFIGAKGFFGDAKANLGRGVFFDHIRPPMIKLWGNKLSFGDFPSWDLIKLVGGLPIFSVSNIAFIAIIIYAGLAKWYNSQIYKIESLFHSSEGEIAEWLFVGKEVLREAPAPAHLGRLLVIFIVFFLANVLFRVFSPTVVREYSRSHKVKGAHTIQSEELEYLSAAYSLPIIRIITFVLLFGSAFEIIKYFFLRTSEALSFFFPASSGFNW